MSQRTMRLTIDIPASEHKRLKTAVSLMDISMKQLVMMSVDDFIQKKFNRTTEKTLKHSRSGKDIKKIRYSC